MNKPLVILLVMLGVAGGAWWYKSVPHKGASDISSMPSQLASSTPVDARYEYLCDEGTEFTMIPAVDLSAIRLLPGANAAFVPALLTTKEGEGARFTGQGITLVGAGEEVRLTYNGRMRVCEPKPNAVLAPFHFGDAGEGAGATQDIGWIVSENILGKWQSVDDAKFVREFRRGGLAVDLYAGATTSKDIWKVYTSSSSSSVSASSTTDLRIFLSLEVEGSKTDVLTFKIEELSPEKLELIYLGRGNTLRFKRVQ